MGFIVEAGELELVKLFKMYIGTIKMVSMNIHSIGCIDHLPVLFVIHLFNILDEDICLPTYLCFLC